MSKKREFIEIGETVRVENGPARKTAVATEELLDDAVTASHYAVGEWDAMGKPIVLGEPMTYLDYRGEWVWYVYQLRPDETHIDGERWLPAGIETTKEAALAVAEGLKE
jgi:hypothetical protein